MYTKDALILITVGVILVLVGVGAVTTSAHVAGWLQ